MSTTQGPQEQKLTFRRYRDGDAKWDSWRDQIFQASWTHKCPTYIQSTPPCQGSCPAGEDIRGYLNIVRGIEKPPMGADGKPSMTTKPVAPYIIQIEEHERDAYYKQRIHASEAAE